MVVVAMACVGFGRARVLATACVGDCSWWFPRARVEFKTEIDREREGKIEWEEEGCWVRRMCSSSSGWVSLFGSFVFGQGRRGKVGERNGKTESERGKERVGKLNVRGILGRI